ncbi:MAG: sugar transferase [Dysgonamonadaceae bacterium]|jgi:exopolysaccharide biosynthesis polyprenyl glycosylphosphotransferase|nr:sugar transferase [Dysgonamonadaceae bacterium]
MSPKNRQTTAYLASDFIAAHLAWLTFNVARYSLNAANEFDTLTGFMSFHEVVLGQLTIPFGWLTLHYYSGYYNRPAPKSRLHELTQTTITCALGSIAIFFVVLLDNLPESFQIYYEQAGFLFLLSFTFTYIPRTSITNHYTNKFRKRQYTRSALIIGTGAKAQEIYKTLQNSTDPIAYKIQGFIRAGAETSIVSDETIAGNVQELDKIVQTLKTDELIIATDANPNQLSRLIYPLFRYGIPINIPMTETNAQTISGHRKIRNIVGLPLIDITETNCSDAETNIKLTLDKVASALIIIMLAPLYAWLALKIRKDSKGPVLIRQERIGYKGKPFQIVKFRTMRENAEQNGPTLSSENDERITRFGKIMRKYRLDELPQFWNVIKGEMSIVGPRPERNFYIQQIVKKAPQYYMLHNVRPGITSLGMVKFGYARNVEEMIERMKYDVIYYENMSLMMDAKILIYSIKTIYTGKGV